MDDALAGSWISEFSQTESLPFLAAVVAVTALLLILTRRRTRKNHLPQTRQRGIESGPRRHLAAERRGSAVSDEVGDLLLQLQTVAREITGQLETRARVLEAVIRDADRKIARLEKLSGGPPANERSAARVDVTVGDDCEVENPTPDAPSNTRSDTSHERIYALADEGASPVAIARRIGRPTGEVELILSLRPAREASAAAR